MPKKSEWEPGSMIWLKFKQWLAIANAHGARLGALVLRATVKTCDLRKNDEKAEQKETNYSKKDDGQNNREILTKYLQYSEKEVDQLETDGVIVSTKA